MTVRAATTSAGDRPNVPKPPRSTSSVSSPPSAADATRPATTCQSTSKTARVAAPMPS
ncbi:hypothetical protein ACFPRL_29905 [Pseudoclavibacter helvolus]